MWRDKNIGGGVDLMSHWVFVQGEVVGGWGWG